MSHDYALALFLPISTVALLVLNWYYQGTIELLPILVNQRSIEIGATQGFNTTLTTSAHASEGKHYGGMISN